MAREITQESRERIEALIDETSLAEVLGAISQICDEKASHIDDNWQDKRLAKAWDRASAKLWMVTKSSIVSSIS